MIENGDKVRYTGQEIKKSYALTYEINRRGKANSEVFQLPNAPGVDFVEVIWNGESLHKDAMKTDRLGHIVNVKNLEKI